jgi:hypothetical protein
MKLTPIKANMNEVEIGDKTILFSYKTPVAYIDGLKAYRTERKWSQTTTKHINGWLSLHPEVLGAQYKPQAVFDGLMAGK